jgi:NAD(P)H-dependent flavin oxidoreductase YrpB (nitropropane dioxygenase family)
MGSVMAGQSAGLVKDIKSVKDIIESMIKELPLVFPHRDSFNRQLGE